jgi:N-acetylglucosamine-6-phosphate deacetylase
MHDAMDATPEAFDEIADFHFRNGDAVFLPTTLTASLESISRAFDCFRSYRPKLPVYLPGLHMEGPFLSPVGKGAQDRRFFLDVDEKGIDFVVRNCDVIKLITIAPDLPGIGKLIEACAAHHIVVSGGHDGSIETEVYEAIEAGMRSVTHIFCSSSTISKRNFERHVGITEVALCTDRLYAEVIADGAHIPYELFNILYKCKGYARLILVSDSIRATGMKPGRYYLGNSGDGTEIEVTEKVAMLADKSMYAGSITTVRKMVENLARNTDIPIAEIVHMATKSPASLLGLEGVGDVGIGYSDRLNVLSPDGKLLATIAEGKVYDRDN